MQGRLDDRRPHDRRPRRPRRDQQPFAERLAERVGVGPALDQGPPPPAPREPFEQPAAAQLLGSLGGVEALAHRGVPGRRLGEARGLRLGPRLLLGGLAPLARFAQHQVGVEVGDRVVGEAVLGDPAALAIGDVGGRDVDEVGLRAGPAQALEQAGGAEGVELQGLVEGLLEGDGRGAVDDGVDPGPGRVVAAERGRRRRDRRPAPGSCRPRAAAGSPRRACPRRARRPAPRRAGGGGRPPRSRPGAGRTSRSIPSPWRSSAASTALPRNPEAPVSRMLLPGQPVPHPLAVRAHRRDSRRRACPRLGPGDRPRARNCGAPAPDRADPRLNTIFRNGAPNATATTQVAYLEVEKDPGPPWGPRRRARGCRWRRRRPGRSTSTTRRRRSPACSRSRRAAPRRSTPPTAP